MSSFSQLLHIWTCDFLNETNELDIDAAPKKPNDFCMKVHSCVAQNPEGQIDITDEQGCEKIPFSVRVSSFGLFSLVTKSLPNPHPQYANLIFENPQIGVGAHFWPTLGVIFGNCRRDS